MAKFFLEQEFLEGVINAGVGKGLSWNYVCAPFESESQILFRVRKSASLRRNTSQVVIKHWVAGIFRHTVIQRFASVRCVAGNSVSDAQVVEQCAPQILFQSRCDFF